MAKYLPLVCFISLAAAAAGPVTEPASSPPVVGDAPRRDADSRAVSTSDRVVFLCDASGSMLKKMETLRQQLHLAIGGLKPSQSFNIVFFNEKVAALDDRRLLPATPENKKRADAFLDKVKAVGTSDPIPGLATAFAQHPQLVYLLTDGDFPDSKAVMAKCKELNRDHKTKINTIAMVNAADSDAESTSALEQIAKENDGVFRQVAEKELPK